ncbi:hypothetical protein V8B97DRAFT_1916552 [Scleroderma yunnanense]
MSSAPLSLSLLLDSQDSSIFTTRAMQDLYNSTNSNFFRCNNSQLPTLPPPTSVSLWGNDLQISQGPYPANNSSVFMQGISEVLHVQQIKYLQDTIMKLQLEHTLLKAECTTIQSTYNTLVAQLTIQHLDSSPLSMDGPMNVTLQSVPISATPLLNTMWKIWHKLCTHGLIDSHTTWSSMSLMTKKAFHIEVAWSHPDLNLCKDSWKVDALVKKHYSSFKKTWFTNKSDERITGSNKYKAKKEAIDDVTPFASPSMQDLLFMMTTLPHQARGYVWDNKPTMSDATPSTSVKDPENIEMSISTPAIKNPLLSMHPMQLPGIDMCPPQISLSMQPSDTPGSSDHTSSPNNSQVKQVSGEGHTVMDPSTSQTVLGSGQPSQASAWALPIQALPLKGAEKKKAWCPPSNKSRRTLCMHHYQKQISSSLEDFNLYFEALSAEAKMISFLLLSIKYIMN